VAYRESSPFCDAVLASTVKCWPRSCLCRCASVLQLSVQVREPPLPRALRAPPRAPNSPSSRPSRAPSAASPATASAPAASPSPLGAQPSPLGVPPAHPGTARPLPTAAAAPSSPLPTALRCFPAPPLLLRHQRRTPGHPPFQVASSWTASSAPPATAPAPTVAPPGMGSFHPGIPVSTVGPREGGLKRGRDSKGVRGTQGWPRSMQRTRVV